MGPWPNPYQNLWLCNEVKPTGQQQQQVGNTDGITTHTGLLSIGYSVLLLCNVVAMMLQPCLQRFDRNIQQPQINISLVYISTRSGSISSTQWPTVSEPILQSWAWLLRLNSFWHHKWTLVTVTAVPGGTKPSHHTILHYRTYEYISMYFSGHDRAINDTNSRTTFFSESVEFNMLMQGLANFRVSTYRWKPKWNMLYWRSRCIFHTVCWGAVGCKWGTTSVSSGITYACFIPQIVLSLCVAPTT